MKKLGILQTLGGLAAIAAQFGPASGHEVIRRPPVRRVDPKREQNRAERRRSEREAKKFKLKGIRP